jgi:hypothetical protein
VGAASHPSRPARPGVRKEQGALAALLPTRAAVSIGRALFPPPSQLVVSWADQFARDGISPVFFDDRSTLHTFARQLTLRPDTAIRAGIGAALLAFQDMLVVRGTALSNYPQLVAELGGDPEPLLRRAGIRPEDIGEYGVFVTLRGAIQAAELAAEATETPDFGRRLALLQGIEILGPVGVAARTAATVGDAMTIFANFMAAYSPGLSFRVAPVSDRPDRSFLEF